MLEKWVNLYLWVIKIMWVELIEILRSDDRGRITIPRWARRSLGYDYGDPLELRVEGSKMILTTPSNEEERRLDVVLKDVKFDRSARRRGERWLKGSST